MAYYYVRDNGTFVGSATGDGGRATSARTGAWDTTAANSYVSVEAAFGATTAPVPGDTIFVASDHDHAYSAAVTYTAQGSSEADLINIISVSTTNQDQAEAGAIEDSTAAATYDIFMTTCPLYCYGVTFKPGDELWNCTGTFENCTFELSSSSFLYMQGVIKNVIFKDCIFKATNNAEILGLISATHYQFINCDFQDAGGSWTGGLITTTTAFEQGSSVVEFVACDFSDVDTALIDAARVSDSVGESPQIYFTRCTLAASAAIAGGAVGMRGMRILAQHCVESGVEPEHQYELLTYQGDVQSSTTYYRDQSVAWPNSGDKTSLVIDTATNAIATKEDPLWFDIPSRYVELAAAAEDKITLYLAIASPTTLTDTDVWAEAFYPDGTNDHVPNKITTRPANFLGAGTTLTSDTGSSWTFASGTPTAYRIEIDTSSDPGQNAIPLIRLYVAKQATIYIDSQVDLS